MRTRLKRQATPKLHHGYLEAKNCSKTFIKIPSVGSVLFALPTEGIFIYLS